MPDEMAVVGINNDELFCEGAWPPIPAEQVEDLIRWHVDLSHDNVKQSGVSGMTRDAQTSGAGAFDIASANLESWRGWYALLLEGQLVGIFHDAATANVMAGFVWVEGELSVVRLQPHKAAAADGGTSK